MPPPEQRLEADLNRPGRVITAAVRVRLNSGRLLTIIPETFSRSGELCLVRDFSATTVAVRERRGWHVVHVRSGLSIGALDRLYEAQLLLRLLDREPVWTYEDGDALARDRAHERCRSILANFDLRSANQPP